MEAKDMAHHQHSPVQLCQIRELARFYLIRRKGFLDKDVSAGETATDQHRMRCRWRHDVHSVNPPEHIIEEPAMNGDVLGPLQGRPGLIAANDDPCEIRFPGSTQAMPLRKVLEAESPSANEEDPRDPIDPVGHAVGSSADAWARNPWVSRHQ
jgi:hypothetical protein